MHSQPGTISHEITNTWKFISLEINLLLHPVRSATFHRPHQEPDFCMADFKTTTSNQMSRRANQPVLSKLVAHVLPLQLLVRLQQEHDTWETIISVALQALVNNNYPLLEQSLCLHCCWPWSWTADLACITSAVDTSPMFCCLWCAMHKDGTLQIFLIKLEGFSVCLFVCLSRKFSKMERRLFINKLV